MTDILAGLSSAAASVTDLNPIYRGCLSRPGIAPAIVQATNLMHSPLGTTVPKA